MKSRIHYGEYSLKHWINLMLKHNIELPDYQRSFVWKKDDSERLIKSMKEGQFIQPITIAFFENDGVKQNLILDGQQRLTTILIAYLGLFPDKSKFDSPIFLSSDDDSAEDDVSEDENGIPIQWTFKKFLEYGDTKETIINNITSTASDYYISVNLHCDDNFFENTFLGFSYIVPTTDNADEKQTFFTKLFRNMNYFGKKLLPIESRKSLYFVKNDLKNFFDGTTSDNKDVLCGMSLLENMRKSQIDFVRYLSILSQYKAEDANSNKVLLGYSAYASRENYYGDYVSYIIGIDQEDRTEKFNGFQFEVVFPDNCWQSRLDTLKAEIEGLKSRMGLDSKECFSSWIDADYWLFGLIFWIIFENKVLQQTNIESLSAAITEIIRTKKTSESYTRSPNRLGNIRERLQESIDIYSPFVTNHAE